MEEAQKEEEIDGAGSLYARTADLNTASRRNRYEKDVFCARERAVAVADYQIRRIREMNGEIIKQPGGRGKHELEKHLPRQYQARTLDAVALASADRAFGTILKNGRRARNTESADDSFARLESRPGWTLYHHTIDPGKED